MSCVPGSAHQQALCFGDALPAGQFAHLDHPVRLIALENEVVDVGSDLYVGFVNRYHKQTKPGYREEHQRNGVHYEVPLVLEQCYAQMLEHVCTGLKEVGYELGRNRKEH